MSGIIDTAILQGIYRLIIQKYLDEPKTDTMILDPLTTLIKLAIVSFKNDGVKIAISSNSISIQSPNYIQGPLRWAYGNKREELHYLLKPIQRSIELYDPETNKDLVTIYNLAVDGLRKLRKSYNEGSSTINHTLDLYITLLEKKLEGSPIILESYEKTKDVSSDLGLSTASKINFQRIFKDIWEIDEINLVSKMLEKAKENEVERKNYIGAIDNILQAKGKIMENKIKILVNIKSKLDDLILLKLNIIKNDFVITKKFINVMNHNLKPYKKTTKYAIKNFNDIIDELSGKTQKKTLLKIEI